jgi:hypothetical protein
MGHVLVTNQDERSRYEVQPYSNDDCGYSVHLTYLLDSGNGRGGYRVATFVDESMARHFAEYCNQQLEMHDTTDIEEWDFV